MADFFKCHPNHSGVKEDFDLYFTGYESGLFIHKKSNCIYASTAVNFIAQFRASLVPETVMKDLGKCQVSFFLFFFFFFFLFVFFFF